MTDFRQAVVVRTNQARRTVDLVYLDTREPVRGVRVATMSASSDSGSWNVPDVDKPASDTQAGQIPATGRALIALVGRVGRKPVIVGWLPPDTRQVAFTDPNREVHRHPSGVVTSTDQFGNVQVSHPGGVTLRIGSPAIENLADVSADANWSIPAGTPPTVTLQTPMATLVIDPATGNITVTSQGDVTTTCKDAVVTTSGNATVVATGNAIVTGAQVLLGQVAGGKRVVVDGDPTAKGDTCLARQNTHVYAL